MYTAYFLWKWFRYWFSEKAEIFNEFFAKQCTVVPNSSRLLSVFISNTDKHLSTVTFYENEIKRAIRDLDPNKAHRNDMISIRMLSICDDSLCGPLGLIFQPCFKNGKYPSEWKKANVVPTYKKNDKQLVKNYRPISLLPICIRSLNALFITNYFISFKKATLSHQSNLDSNLGIHAPINCWLLLIIV